MKFGDGPLASSSPHITHNSTQPCIFPFTVMVNNIGENIGITLHKKWSFPLRISTVNVTNPQFPADIWSHLLKKFLKENLIFCAVSVHAMTTLHCNFVFTLYWHRSIFSLQRWTNDSKKWSDIFFYSSA